MPTAMRAVGQRPPQVRRSFLRLPRLPALTTRVEMAARAYCQVRGPMLSALLLRFRVQVMLAEMRASVRSPARVRKQFRRLQRFRVRAVLAAAQG